MNLAVVGQQVYLADDHLYQKSKELRNASQSFQGDWKDLADFFINEIHHIGEEYFTIQLNVRDIREFKKKYGNFFPPSEMIAAYNDFMWGLDYLEDDIEDGNYSGLLVSFYEDRIEMYDMHKLSTCYYLGSVYINP